MPALVRAYPDTQCQEGHHPHRLVCDGIGCDEYDDCGFCEITALVCCTCNQDWPCTTKRLHEHARKNAWRNMGHEQWGS